MTVVFNPAAFRTQFPEFAQNPPNTDLYLSAWFVTACSFINPNIDSNAGALNYMTAHLIALQNIIADGETPGILTQATIDKVSVAMEAPPAENAWQYWLNLTPYGMQLLALLQVQSAGGFTVGGVPEVPAFRRGYGISGLRGLASFRRC